jgi:hypothetical protein
MIFIVYRIPIHKYLAEQYLLCLENQDLDRKTLKLIIQEQLVDLTGFVIDQKVYNTKFRLSKFNLLFKIHLSR